MQNKILLLFLLSLQSVVSAQLNLSWETNQAMNGGILGYELPLHNKWTAEPIVRFHQNRQYKLYDHREYLKRLHAFSARQFFGFGFRINRYFSVVSLSPEFNISFCTNYSKLGSKAKIFTQVGTYKDSFFTAPIVKAEVVTFRPMNVFENTLSLRAKIPLGNKVSLNYGVGIAAMYYSQIDPNMFSDRTRQKWLFSPMADFGLHIKFQ